MRFFTLRFLEYVDGPPVAIETETEDPPSAIATSYDLREWLATRDPERDFFFHTTRDYILAIPGGDIVLQEWRAEDATRLNRERVEQAAMNDLLKRNPEVTPLYRVFDADEDAWTPN